MDYTSNFLGLLGKISQRDAVVGICGMGYVGLPLAIAVAGAGFHVLGFDIDKGRMETLNRGRSYLRHIGDDPIKKAVGAGKMAGTTDFGRIGEADIVIICVPTPITRHRSPDLSYVVRTAEAIQPHMRPGQLVVLESTTYPGTTREILLPILERGALKAGRDIFLAFSPEREDPGNPDFETRTIPKVVGGDGTEATELAVAFYRSVVENVVPVTGTATAEAVKLTENIFRAVNIALVNELKLIYSRMGIDIWEVIDAAKTKPFGYMPFYPGPGIGGHCIPIDPFYLTWKAREFDRSTRFIELAGEINEAMPYHVVAETAQLLDREGRRGMVGARILLIGIAYKKNIADMRESPAMRIWSILEARGATVEFHDPYVPEIPYDHEYEAYFKRRSLDITPAMLGAYDAAIIAADHDNVDYAMLAEHSRLLIDTRNAMERRGLRGQGRVFKV